MIIATLRIVVPKTKIEESKQILRTVSGPTGAELGCPRSYYYQDLEDESCFAILQEWNSEILLQRYLRSDLYKNILALIDSSAETPEICFYSAASCEGLEVVKRARKWS